MAPNQNSFPFLDLPPELRNEVYYFALGEPETSADPYGPTTCTALAPPAITRTNRQLRAETLPFYYGQNRFAIPLPFPGADPAAAFERWCAVFGPHFRFFTKSLSFTNPHADFAPACVADLGLGFTYKFGVVLGPERDPGGPSRIGGVDADTLDVDDRAVVRRACYDTLQTMFGHNAWRHYRRETFENVIQALCTVAPLCTQINSRMYFSWSFPRITTTPLWQQ
ncbi:uncharacterized protein PG998_010686 [Apiospora kogelbergensis]|uniref:uncharacterized protein n=1 Tax=Apiospora kogelbergensis TaxID=1337665 RepID=UPI00312F958C